MFSLGVALRRKWWLLVLVATSGCASFAPPVGDAKEATVANRAQARWDLLISGRLEEAYKDYLSPAYRSVNSFEKYRGGIKLGLWRRAEVKGVSCESPEICKVTVSVAYALLAKGAGKVESESTLTEIWRENDGSWWFVPAQ